MKSNWGKVYIWTILHCTVSVYSITLYSVCVHYTVQCLCTVLHCTVSVYSVCAQYYTVQCLCTVLHCTVSVYSITLYSVCVQYYTVQCLCAVLHCTFYSITLYIYHSPNAQQIYHNKIWKVQIITKLTTMITRKSWEKLILTNFWEDVRGIQILELIVQSVPYHIRLSPIFKAKIST